jgi:protein-tyrosine phosphatase
VQIALEDRPDNDEKLEKSLREAFEFIKKAKERYHSKQPNFKCLLHCQLGMSRSASICLAYLIHEYKFTLRKAFEEVKPKRIIIKPNHGFLLALVISKHNLNTDRKIDKV